MDDQLSDKLKAYRRKRAFRRTPEPAGSDIVATATPGQLYVMHKHSASHDHFDLRLEQDGVLRSWALPKGPSVTPGEKRLAVEVEDHPLEYGSFEGVIPHGQYGGGTTMLWDVGSWTPGATNDPDHIDFRLEGEKLRGAWTLVRTRGWGRQGKAGKHWLLIKRTDTPPRRQLDRLDQVDQVSVATGRTMDEITGDNDAVWANGASTPPPRLAPPVAAEIVGARPQQMPSSKDIRPQLPIMGDRAPSGDHWIHEIKFDGYRVMARLDHGDVRLLTRKGNDWTERFPEIAREMLRLPVEQAILDGEAVAMAADGTSNFGAIQTALNDGASGELVFQAFDLLYLDGHDLTHATQLARKDALARLIESVGWHRNQRIRYSDHVVANGPACLAQACELGLEGIVSKRVDAPYHSGQTGYWIKTRCTRSQEFVVGGYTAPSQKGGGFGALLLGGHAGGRLYFAGRVGGGFSHRQIQQLFDMLRARKIATSPFTDEVPNSGIATWVKPELVVEVEFTQKTADGRLRHPVFRGLREHRDPSDILLDKPDPNRVQAIHGGAGDVQVAGVHLTHPERILYPEGGITKLDLARYYVDIADWVLPYLARRPLSLVRCPKGWDAHCFFQKHAHQTISNQVPRVEIIDAGGSSNNYVYVESLADLVALVQVSALELHVWGSRVEDVDRPDLMVLDLDPSPDVEWSETLRAASELRERLEDLGLASFPRTTGGKGLHLVVPIVPSGDWEQLLSFARAVCEQYARTDPQRLTINMSKAERQGKIFIDYLRNGRGHTAIASYSTRALAGAPVAVPLRWDELNVALRSDHYRLGNVRRRLSALHEDPWHDLEKSRRKITTKMRASVGLDPDAKERA